MNKFYLYLLLLVSVVFTSCSIEDDVVDNSYVEVVPIGSVTLPETFNLGQNHVIDVTYTKPSSCYVFNNFIYNINENERTVTLVNTVYPNSNCVAENEEVTVGFDFVPLSLDPYIFRFYQGKDENDEDQYLIIEIPVEE